MPTALITGISGFTGSYMRELLIKEGYDVYGTTNNERFAEGNIFSVDLCDSNLLTELIGQRKFDVVIHLAAMSHAVYGQVDKIYNTNILGTRNLLSALYESPHQDGVILLISSAHVYGNSFSEVLDESETLKPNSDYAVSKLSMEYMAELWSERLPIITVRPFNYTGVGQSANFLIPKIVNHFKERRSSIELGNLDISRDFSDVRAVVEMYFGLLKSAPIGEKINVCSGRAYSLREVLTIMSNLSGYEIEVNVNPDFVRQEDVKFLCGSDEKLKRFIGDVKPIAFEETLEWMYSN